jgi:hypothetical protein
LPLAFSENSLIVPPLPPPSLATEVFCGVVGLLMLRA